MMLDRIREGLLRKAGLNEQQIGEALQLERESGQTLDQILVAKSDPCQLSTPTEA